MSSFVENFGLLGIYTRRLPWHDLRGASLRDSGERPYTLSKLYILMAARELARRLEGSGVDVLTGGGAAADVRRGAFGCSASCECGLSRRTLVVSGAEVTSRFHRHAAAYLRH